MPALSTLSPIIYLKSLVSHFGLAAQCLNVIFQYSERINCNVFSDLIELLSSNGIPLRLVLFQNCSNSLVFPLSHGLESLVSLRILSTCSPFTLFDMFISNLLVVNEDSRIIEGDSFVSVSGDAGADLNVLLFPSALVVYLKNCFEIIDCCVFSSMNRFF